MRVEVKGETIEVPPAVLTREEAIELAVQLVFVASGDLVRTYNGQDIQWNTDSKFLRAYHRFINQREPPKHPPVEPRICSCWGFTEDVRAQTSSIQTLDVSPCGCRGFFHDSACSDQNPLDPFGAIANPDHREKVRALASKEPT